MADLSFGQTIGMLKYAMDGAATSHAVIANNVANVNTPNFQRSDVTFKDALAALEPPPPADDVLDVVTTDARHIPLGPDAPAQTFSVTTTVDETTQMRIDGSNVDVDQEMAKLSINSAYAQTMGQLLQTQYSRMHQAITEKPA